MKLTQTLVVLWGFVLVNPLVFGQISGEKEAFDRNNHPRLMGAESRRYDEVTSEAKLEGELLPWSDDYWATYRGGVSFRWQTESAGQSYDRYLYDIPTLAQIESMSETSRNQLSPAEKYDFYRGDANMTLTKHERWRTLRVAQESNGQIPTWYGYCHGWASAAITERQPGKVRVTSRRGYQVTFYASDIKALFAKVYGMSESPIAYLGMRCEESQPIQDYLGRVVSSNCRDTNPGAFHLTVFELIKNRKKGLVADIHFDKEVWNQPIIGYKFRYSNLRSFPGRALYPHGAEGTQSLVDVDMTLFYANESGFSRERNQTITKSLKLSYTLELDQAGFIIGGEWKSEQRPDFLWYHLNKPSAHAAIDYEVVKQLADLSLR